MAEVRILGLSGDAIGAGIIAGLIAWGGQLMGMLWLRRDIDLAHARITDHEVNFHRRKA